MTGTIKVLYEGDPEMAEAMAGELEPKKITVNFDLNKVSSYYVLGDTDEDKYIHTVVDGYDFLFLYEDILIAAFNNKFNPGKKVVA
jgi:hypothetical protein